MIWWIGAPGRFANRVDLIDAGHTSVGTAWTVPGGVTTVYLTVAGTGGTAGAHSYSGVGGGGGGGGAWCYQVARACTPGEAWYITFTAQTSSSDTGVRVVKQAGVDLLTFEDGQNADVVGLGPTGGRGGAITWHPTSTTLAGGVVGSISPSSATVGGGSITSGGGGGTGATLSPPGTADSGQLSGDYPGLYTFGVYGGSGGGWIPGQTRIDSTTTTGTPMTAFCWVEW